MKIVSVIIKQEGDTLPDDMEQRLAAEFEKIPYTDNGEAQLAATLEASGHFVPGSVTVKCIKDGMADVRGTLKGAIHTVTLKGEA